MNKIYSIMFGVVALATTTNLYANESQAANTKSPFYGVFEVRTLSAEDKDINTEVVRASLGAKGMYKYDDFKVIYKLDIDFAPAANSQLNTSVGPNSPFDSDDNFWVRTAVVVIPTKYGTAVMGQGPSGNYLDVYKVLDLFKTNNWDPSSQNKNMLFDQGGYGFNVLSYATPKFANGTLQVKVTNLSLANNNDEDSDALGYRVLYTKGNFYAVFSRVDIDRLVPTNYHRNTLAVSYKMDNFYIAGLYEAIENHPGLGDQKNWGAVLSYQSDDTKYSVGYTKKDADVDAADDDLFLVGVKYQGFKNLEFWAEAAVTDSEGNDNISAGVTVHF